MKVNENTFCEFASGIDLHPTADASSPKVFLFIGEEMSIEEELKELINLSEERKIALEKFDELEERIMRQISIELKKTDKPQGLADILYWGKEYNPFDIDFGNNINGYIRDAYLSVTQKKYKPTPMPLGKICPVCNTELTVNSKNKKKELGNIKDHVFFRLRLAELCCNQCYRIELTHHHHPEEVIIYPNFDIHSLIKMNYGEYLQTDYWKAIREKIIVRDGACILCGNTSNLHVHHKNYRSRGFESYSDLITLCGNCHAKFHDKGTK